MLVISARYGAILATLAATPVLVGFGWNALWGEPQNITWGTITALILAWLAGTGVVAAQVYELTRRDGVNATRWFFQCPTCGNRVAIISTRCSECETAFVPPASATGFRNALLYGVGIFYALFAFGAFVLH